MNPILNDIVGESQSAFIAGRSIFDNVIVTHEVIHSIKLRRKGNTDYIVAKLDMSNAYDRMESQYIDRIMLDMGFFRVWTRHEHNMRFSCLNF